ncbi:MAG: ABC transporter substrate-binding protein [Oscillospiraceae bacterium]
MKKIMKSLAAVACAAAMAATVSGCNKQGGTANGDNTLVIGGIGPVTGPAAVYGIAVRHGIELAIDEINAAGGVNGMTLKLDWQDDEHDPEKSVNAYNTIKDNGAKLLIGTVTSGPCIAVSAEAAKDNMFLLTPSGSAVDCITAGDNCFRVCFTDPGQGKIAADYVADKKLGTKIGVIYDSSIDYSTGILDGFKAECANKGLEIVSEQAFTSDNATDFSVQIEKIKESGADLLFLPIYYQEASLILQQAQGKLNMPILGGDGLDGLIEQLGDKVALAQDVYVMTPYAPSSPEAKSVAFTNAYTEKFKDEIPIQFAADSYDAVYIVKAALEKADVKDASLSISEIGDALKGVMTQIEFDGVTGKTTWTADGEPAKAPKVMQITVKDGVGSYIEA